MKKTHWFPYIPALLTAALWMTLSWSTAAFASSAVGIIDSGNGSQISGWAWNPSSPDTPVDVQIQIRRVSDNSLAAEQTVTADQYRDDLAANFQSSGCHAFIADIDWASLENTEYSVQAFSGGSPLSGTFYYKEGAYSKSPSTVPGVNGANLIPLGTFKTTGYCPCNSCSEGWGRHTSTGAIASSRHTIAVDPRVIPYGSQVMINGVVYTAEDRGGAVKSNHIDIFFDTHGEARAHGVRYESVYLVQR